MDTLTGKSIKSYELREVIGTGGFGSVYRARQMAVERDVAIKIIWPVFASLPAFIRQFEMEAQLVAGLEHPYIVPVYDYWRDPDGAYIVMRWLRGGHLGNVLAQGPMDGINSSPAAGGSGLRCSVAGAPVRRRSL